MKAVSISSYLIQFRLFFAFFTLLAMLLVSQISLATGPQTEEWHYTLRPGDNLLNVSQNLLNRSHTWTDLIRHNKIEQVANLAPGSIIRIPMHWLKHQPKPAKILSISGSAQIKRANGSHFKVLKESTMVRVGDEISTREGNVVIEFADGSTVRLEKQSNLVFNKLSHFGKTGMVDTRLRLKRGALSTEVTPLVKGSRYEISTPSAVAAVRGTEFRIESKKDKTKIEVIEGSVNFSGNHGNVVVEAGHGAIIRKNSPHVEESKLLNPPRPQFADKTIQDLPAKLTWAQQKNAEKYKLQITDNLKNSKLVTKENSTKPEVLLENIQNGDYNVAMRSVSKDGFEGPDAISNVKVDIRSEIAQLLTPLDKSIVDSSKPDFLWQLNDSSILSKLEISMDSNFDTLISQDNFNANNEHQVNANLNPGTYYWRVISMAEDSEQSLSEVRSFSLRGVLSQVKILSVNYVENQVGLFWNKAENAQGYILQISSHEDFRKILKEQNLSKARAHLKLKPGKKYYARVKGIGNELFTSNFGPAKVLHIKTDK